MLFQYCRSTAVTLLKISYIKDVENKRTFFISSRIPIETVYVPENNGKLDSLNTFYFDIIHSDALDVWRKKMIIRTLNSEYMML